MQVRKLINFGVTIDEHRRYSEAAKALGVTVSDICRRALNEAVNLSEKLKTPAPSKEVSPP